MPLPDDAPPGVLVRESQEFQPEPEAVGAVRRFVCDTLGVGLEHPVVLVASELATNAVLHAGTPFRVRVSSESSIRVEVHDGTSIDELEKRSGSGRGLALVEQVADDWGVDSTPPGKYVWAVLPVDAEL